MGATKRLTWAFDAGEEETKEEMRKKRRLSSSISADEEDRQPKAVSVYSDFVHEMKKEIPSCWLLWSQDWSSLLNSDSSPTFDSALQFELVSLCHWFLSSSIEAPEQFKEGANQALKLISSETSLATQMSISSETSLATQMSIDHQASYYSLERLLDSKNELLIRQACSAIAFLCFCCCCNYVKDLSFGVGVVAKLFKLVEEYSLYKPHLIHARRAICSIAWVDDHVKEKIIIKTKHGTDLKWLFDFGDTEEAEHACMMAACIFGGKKDDDTWYTVVDALIPPIVDVMKKAREADDIPVMVAAAYAISSAAEAATPVQIDKLFALGCLRVLCHNLDVPSPPLAMHILDGIDYILLAGQQSGNKKYEEWIEHDYNSPCMVAYMNKYEDSVDDEEKCPSWVAFRNVGDGFPGFPADKNITILQYRALGIAFRYRGSEWVFDLLCENQWLTYDRNVIPIMHRSFYLKTPDL